LDRSADDIEQERVAVREEEALQKLQQERNYLSAQLEDATRELTRLDLLNLTLTLQKRQATAAFNFIKIIHERAEQSPTVEELYTSVVETIASDLFVDSAALLHVNLDTLEFSVIASTGMGDDIRSFGLTGENGRDHLEPAVINKDSFPGPFHLSLREHLGSPYFVWYPILEENGGALALYAGNGTEDLVSKQPFSEASLEIYGAIASVLLLRRDNIISALERRRQVEKTVEKQAVQLASTSESLEEKKRLLAAFQQIGELTLSSLDLDQVLDNLAQQIVQAGIFRSIMIALVDRQHRRVDVVRSIIWHHGNETTKAIDTHEGVGLHYDLSDDNITAEVVRTGRMQIVEGDDERFDRRVTPAQQRQGQISYFIPVKQDSRVLAVLATGSTEAEREGMMRRIEAMQPLLNQVAIALEHARLFQKFRDSQEHIRQAQKMEAVGQLTSGMAHNFNNILQVILGNLELAIPEVPEPVKTYLMDSEKSTHRATEMVRHLLLFARRDRSVKFSSVDLCTITRETIDICNKTFDKKIGLIADLPESPAMIQGHASQLQQILLNLFLNARDALEDVERSSYRIRIDIDRLSFAADQISHPGAVPGPYIRLQIADNGSGMENVIRERVFEPFFTTKEMGKGTGLGLATVYAIVQEHGGWIECKSEPNVGTIFSILLPSNELQSESVAESEQEQQETILVIDDEQMVRHTVEKFLQQGGYAVLEGIDGKDGLEVFERERDKISLVLLDLSMPHMSGAEVLAQLRRLSPEVKVVLFTGYPVGDVDYEGVQGIIRKPIGGRQIVETVRGILSA
jgi:signal transduction histidine kinase